MEPETRLSFRFHDLPTELAILILRFAAQPNFAQPDTYEANNPYSAALKFCGVSRAVRHAILPEMLHTLLLSSHNVPAFVYALRMQKEYAQQNHPLHFPYACYIRKIWIGEFCGCPTDILVYSSVTPSAQPESDLGLLTPVLLGAPSLALDFSSLALLTRCLEHAWTHGDKNIDRERSPPPWSTKSLTLSGIVTAEWRPLTMLASGSAFLASISHLISLPYTMIDTNLHIKGRFLGDIGSEDYNLPQWVAHAPWSSFKGLQSFSLALPHIEVPVDIRVFSTSMDLHIELLTFPASLLKGHSVPWKIKASTETGEGCISLDEVRLEVSHSRVHFCIYCQDWEKVWACGILT